LPCAFSSVTIPRIAKSEMKREIADDERQTKTE
jgi:hypothetical protein